MSFYDRHGKIALSKTDGMTYHTTEGIVLAKIPHGEADALFTIYTRDFGKIRALAQGVQKESAKLRGHLEPLSLSRITFVQGRGGERLTHALLLERWFPPDMEYERVALAWQITDTVDRTCFPYQADPALWNLLRSHLEHLRTASSLAAQKFLTNFHTELLKCTGVA